MSLSHYGDLTQNPSLESGCVSPFMHLLTYLMTSPSRFCRDQCMCCRTPFSHWRYILRSSSFFKKQDDIMWFTKTYKHLRVPKTFSQYCTLHIVCMIHVFSTSPAHLPLAGISLLRGLQKVAPVYPHKMMTLRSWLFSHQSTPQAAKLKQSDKFVMMWDTETGFRGRRTVEIWKH